MKDKKLTVQISEKMRDEFTRKCKELEITKSEIIRECIRKFLAKKGLKNARNNLKKL